VPPRSSLADIFIQVLDENDNNPYFVGDVSNITVREDAPVGECICTAHIHEGLGMWDVKPSSTVETVNPYCIQVTFPYNITKTVYQSTVNLLTIFFNIHSFIHSIGIAESDDSLPFSGASSVPLCYIPFPPTRLPSFFTSFCLLFLGLSITQWYVQNQTIPCCSQELLPFLSVVYPFLPPLSAN